MSSVPAELAAAVVGAIITLGGAWLKRDADMRRMKSEQEAEARKHELALEAVRSKAKAELEGERARIEQVDGPATAAAAFSQVFSTMQEHTMRLVADVAKLEQRLDDQDHEHRVEIEHRDRALANALDALRELQAWATIAEALADQHGLTLPPQPLHVEDVAPERRRSTVTATVVASPTKEP